MRVFVSSTFRDMQREREVLVKRIFPQLRKRCEERGVAWSEVDLRWGITDEESEQGKVLPVCLDEIERCRPFFVGLLGERYGWVPERIPADLLDREPWLADYLGRSATEFEIIQGVLADPAMAGHAFFYFRDPAWPGTEVEQPLPDEIAKHGLAEAERRARDRQDRLGALKQRIRESRLPVREDYPTPEALGHAVLDDLGAVIDRLFPPGSAPAPLDRERAEHAAFARSRTGFYVPRADSLARLDAYGEQGGPPVCVTGEPGAGKSALLANWAARWRESHPDDLVIEHYVGGTAASSDWRSVVRRVLGELARRDGIEVEIPTDARELRIALANALHRTPGRFVLVIDGLDQLDDREGAPDLAWLPTLLPARGRLVVSTLPGRSQDALTARGWPQLEVEPLTPAERERLVTGCLAQYAKALSDNRVRRIVTSPQSANPLFLRTLLEELRVFGVHELLDQRIDYYLEARDSTALFQRVLARWEEDYEDDRPGLVGAAMSLVLASRRGLAEAELLDLLGDGDEALPQAHWSPLHLAAEQSLVNRAGLLGFATDAMRHAVQERYLADPDRLRSQHLLLADYFESRLLARPALILVGGSRVVDELPWQLEQAGEWQRLAALLVQQHVLTALWDADRFAVEHAWAAVEAGSGIRRTDAYRPLIEQPAAFRDSIVYIVARLLEETGHLAEALRLGEHVVAQERERDDPEALVTGLALQAVMLRKRGEIEQALAVHAEEERLCRAHGLPAALQRSLGNQVALRVGRGDLDAAWRLSEEEERLCRDLGDRAALAACLGNRAIVLAARGDADAALALHREEERLCREVGDTEGLARSATNQATLLMERGDLDAALEVFRAQEELARGLGNQADLARLLGNQAVALTNQGRLGEALRLHREEERLFRELGDKAGLSVALGNQAEVHFRLGDRETAVALCQEEERLCRELGDSEGLRKSLANQRLMAEARSEERILLVASLLLLLGIPLAMHLGLISGREGLSDAVARGILVFGLWLAGGGTYYGLTAFRLPRWLAGTFAVAGTVASTYAVLTGPLG